MKLQVLLPLPTYPDGNAQTLAQYAAVVGRRIDAALHVLVHAVAFLRVSSYFGSILADVPAMMADAKAECRDCGAALREAPERRSARI